MWLALAAICSGAAAQAPAAGAAPGAENADVRRVAVVRVAFSTGEVDLPSESTVRAVLTDASTSVNALFGAQTDGALQVQGLAQPGVDVYPANGLPLIALPAPSCDAVVASVRQAVTDAFGVVLSPYDHVVVVQPRMPVCTWSAQSERPGRWVWVNGAASFDRSTLARELARNLGADAAATVTCRDGKGARVPLSAQCDAPVPNGDPTDAMGQGALLSTYHRAEARLLPDALRRTEVAGEVTLDDASLPGALGGSGTRLLLVPRSAAGASIGGAFAVELRKPVPTFEQWPRPMLLPIGVMIRLVPSTFGAGPSQLIDMTPSTTTFTDAALGDQQTFTDPVSGVRIAVVSTNGSQAVVRIGGEPVVDTRPPVFSPGALRAVLGSAAVTLTFPKAVDNVAVDHYEVRRDGQVVGVAATTPAVDRPPAGLAAADYDIAAVDAAGNRALLGSTRIDLAALGITPPIDSVPPVPIPGPPKVASPSLTLTTPRIAAGRGRLGKARLLQFRAPGAGRIVVKIDGRTAKDGRTSQLAVRLSARQARRSTVVAVASRGTLTSTLRTTVKVRSGKLAVR